MRVRHQAIFPRAQPAPHLDQAPKHPDVISTPEAQATDQTIFIKLEAQISKARFINDYRAFTSFNPLPGAKTDGD